MESVVRLLLATPLFIMGVITPMPVVAWLRRFLKPPLVTEVDELSVEPTASRYLFDAILLFALSSAVTMLFLLVVSSGNMVGIAAKMALKPPTVLMDDGTSDPSAPPAYNPGNTIAAVAGAVGIVLYFGLTIWGYRAVAGQGTTTRETLIAFGDGVRLRFKLWGLLGTVGLLGLSLLPLSSLLLAFPAIVPQESVLNEAVSRKRGWLLGILGRISSLLLGLTLLVTILAISVEIVSRLPLPAQGSFSVVPKSLLFAPEAFLGKTDEDKKKALAAMSPELREFCKTPLHEKLPTAFVEQWPFVFLTMYLLDLVVLLFIGSVPLNYNLRNVRVRWKTNFMTAMAFMAVVGLLSFLLAFVNGMNNLTQNTGVPGNVFVLSDGSTDEVFSNLTYGDTNNVERVQADELQLMDSAGKPVLDENDKELWKPITALGIKTTTKNGRAVYLASKETYYSINMVVQNVVPEKRRFVQLRTLDDGPISGMVHNVEFLPGGRWFSDVGVDNESHIECVLGEGIARTIGEDYGKKTLVVGDVFRLGEMEWLVAGIMKSEGTTFGSEIWAKRIDRISKPFGKESLTTLVLRSEKESLEASRAIANYLSKRYTQQKLKAFAEPDYYAELTKTNNTFLVAIIIVCIVMAIGGVFGMMTTMFASIAQRIRDIGVLRLLGFKRWQVMVSFMLESLTIALIGGVAGVLLAWLFADGRSTVSTLGSGGAGPTGKSVALKIVVSPEVMAMGLLFALAMGRLGGLVPALSAMQKKILDSLR